MNILGIETSCDETSASIITDGQLISNVIYTQKIHKKYGGVVPELASQEHLNEIIDVVDVSLNKAFLKLSQLDAIAVTYGPGLMGALLVGLNFAKAMSLSLKIPFLGINHLEGHLFSNYIENKKISFPNVCLLVSGGHTQIWLIKDYSNFDLIGGRFYQKSFLKLYAKSLRISDKIILKIFDEETNRIGQQRNSYSETTDIGKTRTPILTDKIPTLPLISFGLLGLTIFFLANFIGNSDKSEGQLAIIEPKNELKLTKVEENLVDEIEKLKKNKETPIKQTNINIDELENFKTQNYSNFLRQIIAKEDVWIEIKDEDENILISTILKKDESFNLPSDREEVIISASNAGALVLKDRNTDHSDLGSFGSVLNSVNLNSLITNH